MNIPPTLQHLSISFDGVHNIYAKSSFGTCGKAKTYAHSILYAKPYVRTIVIAIVPFLLIGSV